MTTALPPDPYSASAQAAPAGATGSQVPGAALGTYAVTLNTSSLNVSSEASGGLFGYSGAPGAGSLFFSVTPQGGSDPYGNTFATGLSVTQGNLQGVTLVGANMDTTSVLNGSTLNQGTVNSPTIQGGNAVSTGLVLNGAGGQVLSYSSNTATTTYSSNGVYQWTCPSGVTSINVQCWGAGAGGGGGVASVGGESGGGGEYASEPQYTVIPGNVYVVNVGNGGSGAVTGNAGQSGGQTSFDNQGVVANGGIAGGNFLAGTGGTGSSNSIHFDGGQGANAGTSTGGSSGANSGCPTAAGSNANQANTSVGDGPPAAQSGGGQGGTGGNNGANGTGGSGPGGSGGGAGAGSQTNTFSYYYYCTSSVSYYGTDVGGTKKGSGTIYQGNPNYGEGNGTGNQFGFALFNYNQIQSNLSGSTLTSCTLRLTNLHSWYSGGCYAVIGVSNRTSFPSSISSLGGGDKNNLKQFWIAQGATTTFDVGTTIGNDFKNGNDACIMLGPATPSNANPSLYDYGYFYGQPGSTASCPALHFYGTTGTGSNTAGSGADGQVIITYSTSTSLVGVVSPVAGSDGLGNSYNAGILTNLPLQIGNQTTPSGTVGSIIQSSTAGQHVYVAGVSGDTNTYNTGRLTAHNTTFGTTAINSTSPVAISGMVVNVGAGIYRVSGAVYAIQSAASPEAFTITFNGTSTESSMRIEVMSVVEAAGSTVNYGFITSYGGNPSVVLGGTGPGPGSRATMRFDGVVTISGSGSFQVYGKQLSSGGTWTVETNSYMDLMPVYQ